MKKETTKKENREPQMVKQFVVVNYPVGDFLIRIKNAALARKHEVATRTTKLILAVAEVLKNEGFLDEVSKKDRNLLVRIAYKKKEPAILDLHLVSRPGLRVYMSADELEKVKKPSIFIVSTPKGVMSSREAIKKRLGGEIIAEVF